MIINIYFPQRGYSIDGCDENISTVKHKIKRENRLFPHKKKYIYLIQSSTRYVKTITHSDVLDLESLWKVSFIGLAIVGKILREKSIKFF